MNKQKLLYSGKAKSLYQTDDPDYLIMQFRDDMTAFDGEKKTTFSRKGMINNHFNAFIMQVLESKGVKTQFVKMLNDTETLVKNLDMICVESVVRNLAAGHLCSRLGLDEGLSLNPPTQEFFLKNDALHDPMINDSLILTLGWANVEEIEHMKTQSAKINEILKPLFSEAGLILVDFKLEFGRHNHQLLLGDEFSPDGCRIWDKNTGQKLDKDRFRKNLGEVIESYEQVAQRLHIPIPS